MADTLADMQKISRRTVLASGAAVLAASSLARATSTARAVDPDARIPHLIIGTGYGGAVLAQRLTEAGHDVVMLEMGQDWVTPGADGKIFTKIRQPDQRSMWFRTRTAVPVQSFLGVPIDQTTAAGPGALDRIDFAQMSVYAGRGVGGGSLVNGAMAVTPPRSLVEERFTGLDVDAFYGTWIPRAQAGLGVARHDADFLASSEWYQFARTGRQSAERAGYPVVDVPTVYDTAYLQAEAAGKAPGSATAGEVIFGNNYGKKSLAKTYLARARATGRLTIRTMTAARMLQRDAGGWRVQVEQVNPDNSRTPLPDVLATRVYLGAGSIGTADLLQRSKAHGLEVPDAVGHGWAPNGNIMVGRANHMWQPTGAKQSTIPVYGIDAWTGVARTDRVFAEIAPMPAGIETWASLYLAIADSPQRGSFGFDAANDRLTLDWNPGMAAEGIAAVKRVFDRINQANATVYRNDLFGAGKVFSDNFTYHPLGGALLGEATDQQGRLVGHDDLFITDGSLVPGVVGVNPFVTITALAEMIADAAVRTA